MKKADAYLCGYYGMHNTGDDALLVATAWGAQKFLGANSFKVSTPNNITLPILGNASAQLNHAQLFRGQNRLLNYKAAMLSKRIIFGGGSVFHTAQDINIKRHMMSFSAKSGHIAIGVGIGPFKNSKAEIACKKFLNECDFIGVRDNESFHLAHSLAPGASIQKTFDLAPLLLAEKNNILQTTPKKGICFILCPHERFFGDMKTESKRLDSIAHCIQVVYDKCGEPITLLDFNGHKKIGDQKIHLELRKKLAAHIPVTHMHYDKNPLNVLKILSKFKAVISMRLHGSIMSFLADTPAISLNYHSKCDGWCQQIGMPENYRIAASNIDSDHLAKILLTGLESGFSSPKLSKYAAFNASLKNWRNEYVQPQNLGCHPTIQQT